MPQPNPRKHMVPKFKKVATQPATQTLKANATPRIGQGTRTQSAYKALHSQRATYAGVAPSYNVGRTRRVGHKV